MMIFSQCISSFGHNQIEEEDSSALALILIIKRQQKLIMNQEQNLLKLNERVPKSSVNPFQGKYFSARSPDTQQITYENRIFNIKKKFTVPAAPKQTFQKRRASIVNKERLIISKPSEIFSKHSDVIVKNRRLLRRGVWEVPFEPNTVVQMKRHRYKTEIQQSHSPKNYKGTSTKDLQQIKTSQLPALRSSHQIGLPIRLSTRYGTKPLSCKASASTQQGTIRNALNRKLAVQLINYSLLGKWASSSLKL